MYTDVNVNISDNQKQKIRNALAAGTQLSLRLSHEDLVGNDVIAVTQSQLNRLKKAHQAGKGVTIKMSKSQVVYNMKIQGGFLPLLAGLASQALPFLTGTVLPALGVGASSGLASTGVQKLVGMVCISRRVDVYARSKRTDGDCTLNLRGAKVFRN